MAAVPPSGGGAGDLLELFGLVTDDRSGQGRDHPVAAVLALAGPAAQAPVAAAQAEAGAKTKEVPMATDVLGQIDLNGKVVTADALPWD